ncbi:MAG: SRPBCC family protein, partial [Alphaproteobacteria bacterium]
AFANVCRHQSLPVLDAGTGRSPLLRCRYHGWTYHFDGSFKEAPIKFEPPNPANPENNLKVVPLAEWRGLLFVSPAGARAELEAALRPLEPALDAALAAPASLAAEFMTDLSCNWKHFAEHWLALESEHRLWHFPTLALEAGPGVLTVHQVIPRTHERTRVVTHVLVSDAARGGPAVEAAKATMAASMAASEVPAAPGSPLAQFRARIAAAHGSQDRG